MTNRGFGYLWYALAFYESSTNRKFWDSQPGCGSTAVLPRLGSRKERVQNRTFMRLRDLVQSKCFTSSRAGVRTCCSETWSSSFPIIPCYETWFILSFSKQWLVSPCGTLLNGGDMALSKAHKTFILLTHSEEGRHIGKICSVSSVI